MESNVLNKYFEVLEKRKLISKKRKKRRENILIILSLLILSVLWFIIPHYPTR